MLTIGDLRGQLAATLKMRHSMGILVPPEARFYGIEDLVLQHGQGFNRAPEKIIGGVPKTCFATCYRFATRSKGKWIYCEGYAVREDLGLVMPHAWVLLADDPTVAHDPTWEPGHVVYWGIPFQESYIRKVWKDCGRNGFCVLDCWWLRFPLLTGKARIEDVIWHHPKT